METSWNWVAAASKPQIPSYASDITFKAIQEIILELSVML